MENVDEKDEEEYEKGEEEDENENVDENNDEYEKGEEADVWREGMSALQWLSMIACRADPCPFSNLD